MKRIFVYEYLSAGGPLAGDDALADWLPLLPLGRSMRDAMVADLLALEDCEVSLACIDPTWTGPPAGRPVRPRSGESAFDFVAREADRHDLTWLVAPETDGLLSRFERCVDPARWLGCDAAAIALASGKRATLERLAAAAMVTPLAFEHASEVTRWVVKPDDGAGGTETRVHASRDAALADGSQRSQRTVAVPPSLIESGDGCRKAASAGHFRAAAPMTVEPWVDGAALSVSLLCGAGRAELLSVNRQQIEIDADGRLSYGGVDIDAWPRSGPHGVTLEQFAADIARAIPGLRGFVGVDLVWHERRGPVAIEVNPRVTCAYVGLSRALGRNLAGAVIAAASGKAGHGGA